MNIIKAIRLEALGNVLTDENADDDPEYRMRYIFRWYSKTFSTPLHVVEELPLVEVLRAFFEERYESMEPAQLEEERFRLCETDEERKSREAEESQRDSDDSKYAAEAAKWESERQARIAKKKGQPITEPEKTLPNQLVIETMGGNQARVVPAEEVKAKTQQVAQAEPVIRIEFPTDLDFEKQLEGYGTMGAPERKP